MYGIVRIGSKDVEMVANGATSYRYQQIFHEDMIKKLTSTEDGLDMTSFMVKLGFVMAMQAEKKRDMNKVNMDTFYEWLGEFEALEPENAAQAISDLYEGNQKSEVDPK